MPKPPLKVLLAASRDDHAAALRLGLPAFCAAKLTVIDHPRAVVAALARTSPDVVILTCHSSTPAMLESLRPVASITLL